MALNQRVCQLVSVKPEVAAARTEASMEGSVLPRSVFSLGPNDEVLRGLLEVDPALQAPCSQQGPPCSQEGPPCSQEPPPCTQQGPPCSQDGPPCSPPSSPSSPPSPPSSPPSPPPSPPAAPAGLGDVRQDRGQSDPNPGLLRVSDKMECLACRHTFTNRDDQMEHYKLDWHRFNLKQKMLGMPPVTAEVFEKKTGAGDVSSISGSESDTEENDNTATSRATDNETSLESGVIPGRPSTKVTFQNSAGQYLSVHRCILQSGDDAGLSLKNIHKKTLWVILMTGGGHFAGAIFQGKEILQHKTFHRYTVRAKRGTAQGLKDSQNRSHAPKSAGAALRRYNEAALVKDIQDLLGSWSEHLKESAAIFIRAPSYNKGIFFGGRAAPLHKKDPRIHSIPFATRRATFHEVQRVHEVLSTIHVYGKDVDVSAVFSPSKKVWKKTVKHAAQEKTDPDTVMVADDHDKITSEEEEDEIQLEMSEVTLGTLDLRESEIYPSRHQRRKRRRKKEERNIHSDGVSNREADGVKDLTLEVTRGHETTETSSKMNTDTQAPDDSVEYGLRDSLFTACKVGDVDTLHRLLQQPTQPSGPREQSDSHSPTGLSPLSLLNEPLDSSGFTLLHVASAAAQKVAVRLLMDAGADPGCRDSKGQTPYIVAPDKDTRNVFRKYMGDNPDRYDYKKAQVPGPLTVEMESKQLEKKKAQKALKKQRDREQKEEKKKQELEAEEKRRFASLTDREKRALAAEKRLAKQVAVAGVDIANVKRCWWCGESLLGQIPFQYLDYSFCTSRCVQAHRKANAPPGKT